MSELTLQEVGEWIIGNMPFIVSVGAVAWAIALFGVRRLEAYFDRRIGHVPASLDGNERSLVQFTADHYSTLDEKVERRHKETQRSLGGIKEEMNGVKGQLTALNGQVRKNTERSVANEARLESLRDD